MQDVNDPIRYWHGGRGGMSIGQYLLPPAITGAKSQAKFGNYLVDETQVYVTTSYEAAAMFAAAVPNGAIYRVEPIGKLRRDPDCIQDGLSFSCERAVILRRYKLSQRDRQIVMEVLIDVGMIPRG